jgi:hypothetical protein
VIVWMTPAVLSAILGVVAQLDACLVAAVYLEWLLEACPLAAA